MQSIWFVCSCWMVLLLRYCLPMPSFLSPISNAKQYYEHYIHLISDFFFSFLFIVAFSFHTSSPTLQLSWLSANKNQTVVHYTNQFPFRRFIFQFESGVTVIACALCLVFRLFKLWNNIHINKAHKWKYDSNAVICRKRLKT